MESIFNCDDKLVFGDEFLTSLQMRAYMVWYDCVWYLSYGVMVWIGDEFVTGGSRSSKMYYYEKILHGI